MPKLIFDSIDKEIAMKRWLCLILGTLLLAATNAGSTLAADARIGGMRLLPGYLHQPLQGFDSIVGKIAKKDGLQISYEIGSIPKPGGLSLGGQFSDRPKRTPKNLLRWYREQIVNGQPVHLAYRKDNILLVSYPKKGMNLSVKISSADEMAEALLMILTYPNTAIADGEKKQP